MAGLVFAVVVGAASFACGVFFHAKVIGWWQGAESYAASLRAKADAVAAKIKV